MPLDNLGSDAFYTAIISIATAIGTAIAAYLKKKFTDAMVSIKRIESSLPVLLKIADEMKPNGGGSLRDKIDCIAKKVMHHEVSRRMLVDLALETPFMECDKNGECIYASREWSKLTGITNNDAKGHGWLAAIINKDRERINIEWSDSVKHDIECNTNATLVNQTTVNLISRVLRLDNGEVVGFIAYLKPTTLEQE